MPTYDTTRRFEQDYASLSTAEREAFRTAIKKFVADLERGQRFRKSLRVKGVQGTEGVFEMTWAPNGRATFQYGPAVREGAYYGHRERLKRSIVITRNGSS